MLYLVNSIAVPGGKLRKRLQLPVHSRAPNCISRCMMRGYGCRAAIRPPPYTLIRMRTC